RGVAPICGRLSCIRGGVVHSTLTGSDQGLLFCGWRGKTGARGTVLATTRTTGPDAKFDGRSVKSTALDTDATSTDAPKGWLAGLELVLADVDSVVDSAEPGNV